MWGLRGLPGRGGADRAPLPTLPPESGRPVAGARGPCCVLGARSPFRTLRLSPRGADSSGGEGSGALRVRRLARRPRLRRPPQREQAHDHQREDPRLQRGGRRRPQRQRPGPAPALPGLPADRPGDHHGVRGRPPPPGVQPRDERHDPHERVLQQGGAARRRLLLPGPPRPHPHAEAGGRLLRPVRGGGPGPAAAAAAASPAGPAGRRRGGRRREEGGGRGPLRGGPAGVLQAGAHHGLLLPVRPGGPVHEGGQVLPALGLLHPHRLHPGPGPLLQRRRQGDQGAEPRADGRVERLDAAGHPHLPHVGGQQRYGHFSYFWIKGDFGIHRVCQVLFRLNFLVVVLCIVMDRPYQFYYFVPLVTVWFLVIYVTLALWPQITQKKANGSCVWHVGLLMKLASLFLCICFLAYSQGAFEKIFSLWPLSKCFELNGNIYEWWFRWKLDRYVVFHGMLFAFVYLALQKRQVLSEGKGEPLLPPRVANVLLFVSVVSFLTYSIWASSCKTKAECNELHPAVSVVQILAFVLIRNIPGYARSVYSSFFAWFGKISLELFICQYHIWLAADTRGVLVLIPGSPALNVTVSTFIFVCVAHEVSRITNDLAHVLIPTESAVLWKRLACLAAFFSALLLLSSVQGAP